MERKKINIVEDFLKRKRLICYGGTAINNILPKKDQFYKRKEFILQMVREVIEEEFIPPAGEPLTPEELTELRIKHNIGKHGYEQGEWFGETSKAEGEDFWSLLGKSFTGARSVLEEWGRGSYSLDNLKEIAFQIDALEKEEEELRTK